MQTTTFDEETGHVMRNPLVADDIGTRPQNNQAARKIAFGLGALVAPVAVGAGLAAFLGSRRAGWIAGGATALAVALTRWQLQRWFTAEPAYEVERRIGKLEIRRYAPRVEAHTTLASADFDEARERGFRRLFSYITGTNADAQTLEMTCPVTIAHHRTAQTVAFVMPPGHRHSDLPHPSDARVYVVDVPERRVAVLRYHGGYAARTVERHAQDLRARVAEAGLTAIGEPMFAGFDPPSTLPFLRRTEVWLQLV